MTFNKQQLAPNQETASKEAGTFYCTLRHAHRGWATDSKGYDFGALNRPPISIIAKKKPDQTLSIAIEGPFDSAFMFTAPTPATVAVRVVITWEKRRLRLYLNGERAQTITA